MKLEEILVSLQK